MRISIKIDRKAVFDEVARTTSYTGAKMEQDEEAYKRIFTTDEDEEALSRFWNECRVDVCEILKKFYTGESSDAAGNYEISLELSSSFDPVLTETMQNELFSFFVMGIVAKWYVYTNKAEAQQYTQAAASLLEGVHRKACHKRKPQRPTYN